MDLDKKELIELYKIALEEAQHRDRLYTQTWMAVVISATVLFAALGLFWGKYSLSFWMVDYSYYDSLSLNFWRIFHIFCFSVS